MKDLLEMLTKLTSENLKLEAQIDSIKKELETNYLTEEGYKDGIITISFTKPSKSVSIDTKALESKEPMLYNEILNCYSKITERKGFYRYNFKGGN